MGFGKRGCGNHGVIGAKVRAMQLVATDSSRGREGYSTDKDTRKVPSGLTNRDGTSRVTVLLFTKRFKSLLWPVGTEVMTWAIGSNR